MNRSQFFRFDPTINTGHALNALTIVTSLIGAIWYISSSQAELRKDIAQIQARGAIYGPIVDELKSSQRIQDERIASLADSSREMRKLNSDILQQLGNIRETLADVRARLPPK